MADLDAELLERAVRWCAEAGRTATPATLRRALSGLGWEELLTVRALLADPPPVRPLGPFALADLARGAPADVAAERERGGRYPSERGDPRFAEPSALEARSPPSPPLMSKRKGARRGKGPGMVIRRARDAAPATPAASPASPLVEELLLPEGRAVLERLLRKHGARRKALVDALAAWRTPGGGTPGDAELTRLLEHHDLGRAFARREKDELLHALRAASGILAEAAVRLGLDVAALSDALDRLGAKAAAEKIREERRAALRRKTTLAERLRLVLSDGPRLEDLGLLAELEEDLRRRLPEHARALRAVGGPLHAALSASLSITPDQARTVAERFGLTGSSPASPAAGKPPVGGKPVFAGKASFSGRPRFAAGKPPFGGKPPFSGKPPYAGKPPFGGKPRIGGKPPFAGKPRLGGKPSGGERPARAAPPAPGKRPYDKRPAPGKRPYDKRPAFGKRPYDKRPAFGKRPYDKRPAFGKPTPEGKPFAGGKQRGGARPPRRRPPGDRFTPSTSGRASPSRTPPRPRTSRRSPASSSGR